jgi:protease IV
MNFLKTFFASLLALIAFSILSFIFLIIVLVGLGSAIGSEPEVNVKDNSVLMLELDAPIRELQADNPLEGLPIPAGGQSAMGLLQIKDALAHAKNDAKIKGIVIDPGNMQTGFATLDEIRESIIDFRKSG